MRYEFRIKQGTKVHSQSGGLIGEATGSTHTCTLEGCGGLRVSVRWPDGKITFPCSRGMFEQTDGSWRIQ